MLDEAVEVAVELYCCRRKLPYLEGKAELYDRALPMPYEIEAELLRQRISLLEGRLGILVSSVTPNTRAVHQTNRPATVQELCPGIVMQLKQTGDASGRRALSLLRQLASVFPADDKLLRAIRLWTRHLRP